jgi:hypothetical protein
MHHLNPSKRFMGPFLSSSVKSLYSDQKAGSHLKSNQWRKIFLDLLDMKSIVPKFGRAITKKERIFSVKMDSN